LIAKEHKDDRLRKEAGSPEISYKINSVYDLGWKDGLEEGEIKGDRNRLRKMLNIW